MALLRFLWLLLLALLSPLLLAMVTVSLALVDLRHRLRAQSPPPAPTTPPDSSAASVVIPNWNGRDLLERYLPSVVEALAGNPCNEIIVVDNASEDGSADFVRAQFPQVRLLALAQNLGFGGGSNAGFQAASNDIVVLLNSDMRVEPDFLAPLLEGFENDPAVFAVACQIFFSDPTRRREETGLTEAWWQEGSIRVRHRSDAAITDLFPCFYPGGGSSAFDRRKFLELGGFDPILAPFYLEDADIGYMAWKRGWKVLYQPRSIVYHEHRGTIGRHFSPEYIASVLRKNYLLFVWKNIHDWRRLASHFFFAWSTALLALLFGDTVERSSFPGIWQAFRTLPAVCRARSRAHRLSAISDTEALRRPMGGYFRDRFAQLPDHLQRLRVLFVSPYPLLPPSHGGAVFMSQTLRALGSLAEVHLLAMMEKPEDVEAQQNLLQYCASLTLPIRDLDPPRSLGLEPHAVREFASVEFRWLLHRILYQKQIDVLQIDYTNMGQYTGSYRRIATFIFEHDIYFQSIFRSLRDRNRRYSRFHAFYEYLRALRFELHLLPQFDRIQVCSSANKSYLASYLPQIAARIDDDLRAGIDVTSYVYRPGPRRPDTMLFLGSFRHAPNLEALGWFLSRVMPLLLKQYPQARLMVAGSELPQGFVVPPEVSHGVTLLGFVGDVRVPLSECAVFIAPILSGSGIRVKLLEAFAAGIPVVATSLGAEGLAASDGDVCRIADDPAGFAAAIHQLLEHPEQGEQLAARARQVVEQRWDLVGATHRLAATYRKVVAAKRSAQSRRDGAMPGS